MSMTYMDPRVFLILEMVLKEDSNTLEKFSNVLGVSTRTIRNYINQINQELKDGIAKIVKNEKGTYSIRIENESKLNEILNFNRGKSSNFINLNSPYERINYVLDVLTMTSNPITIDDLAEQICIGRTTLIKDLKKADKILEEYDLELKRKPNIGMILVGEEMDIRLLILDRLYENYIDILENVNYLNAIDYSDIECLRDELKKLFKQEEFYITEQVLKDVERYIIISILRNLNAYKFEKIDKRFEVIRCSDEYIFGLKLKSLSEKVFNIILNEKETIFLTMPLIGRKAPSTKLALSSIKINDSVKEVVDEVTSFLLETSGIDFKEDKKLIENLEYHLYFALNRMRFNIRVKNPLLQEIKERYTFPYSVAKIAAMIIEEKFDLKICDHEIGYIALHFGSYFEKSSRKILSVNRVAVVCGTGLGTAQLIRIKIGKILGESVEVNTFSDIEAKANLELLKYYDLVFTTVDFKTDLDVPIFRVNALFNEENLKKEIENAMLLKNSINLKDIKKNQKNIPFIGKLVEEDKFFILDKDTFIENLEEMLENLVYKEIIDIEFKKNVLKREKKSSTALDNYIALPHSVSTNGENLYLAFGILKKPVTWDTKEIRIIILMIIPDKNIESTDLIIKSYEEVLELGRDKKMVEALAKVKSFDEFYKIITKRR